MEDYKENKLNLNKQQVIEYTNQIVKDYSEQYSEEEQTWNEKITYLVGNMMSCFSQVENATFIKVLENLVKRNIFDDEYQRKLFLSIAIVSSNSNDIQQQAKLKKLMRETPTLRNSTFYDVCSKFYKEKYSQMEKEQSNPKYASELKDLVKNFNVDASILKSNRYITIYRGFNTRRDKQIRYSNRKNDSDYFRQNEGAGISFTLDKYIAYGFSTSHQFKLLRKDGMGFTTPYEMMKMLATENKSVGRMTLGRYVVHTDNIFAYVNTRREREVLVDPRFAKLIDYKFVSDLGINAKEMELIGQTLCTVDYTEWEKYLKRLGNQSWINTHYKNDYRVTKKIEELF